MANVSFRVGAFEHNDIDDIQMADLRMEAPYNSCWWCKYTPAALFVSLFIGATVTLVVKVSVRVALAWCGAWCGVAWRSVA